MKEVPLEMDLKYGANLLLAGSGRLSGDRANEIRKLQKQAEEPMYVMELNESDSVYLIRSYSDPETVYQVDLVEQTCDCYVGAGGKVCKHLFALAKVHQVPLQDIYSQMNTELRMLFMFVGDGIPRTPTKFAPDVVVDFFPSTTVTNTSTPPVPAVESALPPPVDIPDNFDAEIEQFLSECPPPGLSPGQSRTVVEPEYEPPTSVKPQQSREQLLAECRQLWDSIFDMGLAKHRDNLEGFKAALEVGKGNFAKVRTPAAQQSSLRTFASQFATKLRWKGKKGNMERPNQTRFKTHVRDKKISVMDPARRVVGEGRSKKPTAAGRKLKPKAHSLARRVADLDNAT